MTPNDMAAALRQRAEEEAQAARDHAANRDKALARAVDLRNLAENRGWHHFEAYLASEEERLVTEIALEKDAALLQRLSSALFTVKCMRNWRALEIGAADELLQVK